MGETVMFGRAIEREVRPERDARAERRSAHEAQATEARLVAIEDAIRELHKWSWPNGLREMMGDVLGEIRNEIETEAEKRLRGAISAMREELAVEVAVSRDELASRIDAKRFGTALDFDLDAAKRAIGDLRSEVAKRDKLAGERLDVLVARLDRMERQAERRELDRWQGVMSQLARHHKGLAAAATGLAELERRLVSTAAEVRALREILVEAEIVAPDERPIVEAEGLSLPPFITGRSRY